MLHKNRFDENMYLDAATRTKSRRNRRVLTSSSLQRQQSCHRSPTVSSFYHTSFLNLCCQGIPGLKLRKREIYFDEVKDFAGMWSLQYCCSYISCRKRLLTLVKKSISQAEWKMGPVIQKLYDTLTGIQMGRIQAPEGWLKSY